jgi:sulfur-carrier protein
MGKRDPIMNCYHIHYFGLLADKRGLSDETVRSAAQNPSVLFEELAWKQCVESRVGLRAVVNDVFVPWNHALANEDRVAFLPPMSGG